MPALSIPGIDSRLTDLATFTVKVDGKALPETFSIVAVDIVRAINRLPFASLVLHDGDAAKQEFEISAGDLLTPGNRLQIDGGYHSDEETLFDGIITGQRIKVRRNGASRLHVEARDAAFPMTATRRSAHYTESTNSEIFEAVIGRYGIPSQVEQTAVTFGDVVQHQVSDWDFLVSRAETDSMFCLPDNGTFRVEKPNIGQDAAITLTYGGNIFDVDLDMDARTQFASVDATCWDQANQEVAAAEIDDEPSPSQGNLDGTTLAEAAGSLVQQLRHDGSLPTEQLETWAHAAMLRSRFSRIRGTVRFQGNQVVAPGKLVELAGLGDRFNGKAFVSGVRHVIGSGNWETIAQIGFPPTWHRERFDTSAPAGGGLNSAVSGLMVGVVTQLENDPRGEQRIKVSLPLVDAQQDGIWARLATMDAGGERGWVFRPEIGDEVVIGFLNGDPNAPVVLGALHSSDRPAPIQASDDNHEKGIVTRSGIKLMFDDDAVALDIETPNGNKIQISDDEGRVQITDESSNAITMNADGITLESAKDIVIKASRDVQIEGVNIELKAQAQLTAEGSAGATVSSSGTTDVKGSLVRIN